METSPWSSVYSDTAWSEDPYTATRVPTIRKSAGRSWTRGMDELTCELEDEAAPWRLARGVRRLIEHVVVRSVRPLVARDPVRVRNRDRSSDVVYFVNVCVVHKHVAQRRVLEG